MNIDELHDEMMDGFDKVNERLDTQNGHITDLRLAKAKAEGIILGGKILPLLPAYIAAGAALVIAIRQGA